MSTLLSPNPNLSRMLEIPPHSIDAVIDQALADHRLVAPW